MADSKHRPTGDWTGDAGGAGPRVRIRQTRTSRGGPLGFLTGVLGSMLASAAFVLLLLFASVLAILGLGGLAIARITAPWRLAMRRRAARRAAEEEPTGGPKVSPHRHDPDVIDAEFTVVDPDSDARES
jgi:hypothetical protein